LTKHVTSAAWFHNAGAYDPDGDSLSYEFEFQESQDAGCDQLPQAHVMEFYATAGFELCYCE